MFKRLLARHGLRGYSPSSLRWGRARELLQKGVHVLDIQEFVGWNTLRPVLRLLPRSETPIPGLLLNYDAEQFQLPDPRQRLSKDRLTGDLFEGASSTRGMGSSSSV
jgi:hypothetical protein